MGDVSVSIEGTALRFWVDFILITKGLRKIGRGAANVLTPRPYSLSRLNSIGSSSLRTAILWEWRVYNSTLPCA